MNTPVKTPSPTRSHSRRRNSSPRLGSSGRNRRRRRMRMLRARRAKLWASSARQAAIATQPRLTRAPRPEPWRSKDRHSRARAPGVSGSMWMSSMASSSSLMTICCSQPWELIILSIAGGVAAGASAPWAGTTESNNHKNNTRPEQPARKAPRPRAPSMSVKRMPVSRINTIILGRWPVTCSVFFPQDRAGHLRHRQGNRMNELRTSFFRRRSDYKVAR